MEFLIFRAVKRLGEDLRAMWLVSNCCLSREALGDITRAMVASFWALTSYSSSLVTVKAVLFADVPNGLMSLAGPGSLSSKSAHGTSWCNGGVSDSKQSLYVRHCVLLACLSSTLCKD